MLAERVFPTEHLPSSPSLFSNYTIKHTLSPAHTKSSEGKLPLCEGQGLPNSDLRVSSLLREPADLMLPLLAILQGWGSVLWGGDMDSGFLSFTWVVAQTVKKLGTLVETQWLEVLLLCSLS